MHEKEIEDLIKHLTEVNRQRLLEYLTDNCSVREKLRVRYDAFMTEYRFDKGQFVRWKNGLKNRKHPAIGEPAVVLEVLDSPLYDSSENSGTPYFYEPLDLLLGVLNEEGDLMCLYFDSRRFEPFEDVE